MKKGCPGDLAVDVCKGYVFRKTRLFLCLILQGVVCMQGALRLTVDALLVNMTTSRKIDVKDDEANCGTKG